MNKYILSTLIVFLFFACKKVDNGILYPTDYSNVPILDIEQTAVKTYKAVSLIIHDQSLSEEYQGQFGSEAIELLRFDDTTLVFLVPDVSAGEYELNFDLGKATFTVEKTEVGNPDSLVQATIAKFDQQVAELEQDTAIEMQEVEEIIAYKQEVLSFYNNLSADDKMKTALLFEANKEIFAAFENTVTTILDASTIIRGPQSECSRNNFGTFYFCTAENLGEAAEELRKSSKEFLIFFLLTGAAALQGNLPAGAIAGTVAAAFFYVEVRPALLKFKNALKPFLEAQWIFVCRFFNVVTENVVVDFINNNPEPLPTDCKVRTIKKDDNISEEVSFFNQSMSRLSLVWDKLKDIFGDNLSSLPQYMDAEAAVTLEDEEIEVLPESISNPNVELEEQTATTVKFSTSSNQQEEFTFVVQAEKEGFVEEQTINGRVDGSCSSTDITFDVSYSFDPDMITISNVQGGVSPYSYSIDNINFTTNSTINTMLVPNTEITVFVEDANGCVGEQNVFLSLDICPTFIVSGAACIYENLMDYMNGEYNYVGEYNSRPWYRNLSGTVDIDYGPVGSPPVQKWRIVASGLTTIGGTTIGTIYFNDTDSSVVPTSGWEIISFFTNSTYGCGANASVVCQ